MSESLKQPSPTPESKEGTVPNASPKWNKLYREQDQNAIPWNFEEIPLWFTEIIDSGWVKPCRTLSVGCGLGNYENYLAAKQFDVLGVDWSGTAVEMAKKKYSNDNLDFRVCNALDLQSLGETFDFVYEVSLFHHIHPDDRRKYAEQIAAVAKSGAKVLVCCFSEKEKVFGGEKVWHAHETDTVTYLLSKDEILDTFKDDFAIDDFKEVAFGKTSQRIRNLVLLTRK